MPTQIRFRGPGAEAAELIAELRAGGHEPAASSSATLHLDERVVNLVITIPGGLDGIIDVIDRFRARAGSRISTSEDSDTPQQP